MQEIYNKLLIEGIDKKNIFLNEPMNKHTSFKTGGNAKYFIEVYSVDDIKKVLKISKEYGIQVFVMGNGTNILIRDEGFEGIILQIKIDDIKIEDCIVTVSSGVKNMGLAQKLVQAELTGFEFASGIPGTIGGAIKMNAGAYGSEMKDIVKEVTYLDYEGNIYTINKEECNFGYRYSRFFEEKGIILQVKMQFTKGKKEEIESVMLDLAKQRKEKQPLEYPNAGSTFKRGEDFITAKLIDECGLKGYKLGGAQVSEKHAGFIINKDNATSNDIIKLIEYVQKTVKDKTGKQIKLEIEIL